MKKYEFLAELETHLSSVGDAERWLAYYAEMIDDRMEDGLSEEEAVAAVGMPREIAASIGAEPISPGKSAPTHRLSPFAIVLLILGAPIWLSLLMTAVSVALSLYAVAWVAIVVLWVAELALAVGGIAGVLLCGSSLVYHNIGGGIAFLGAGLLLAGLSIYGFHACLCLTRWLCVLTRKIARFLSKRFGRKENHE